jgi:exodeoxyribonuclease V alpha subunit
LTVHKSQGSEYDRVVLLLPGHQEPGRLASRELLYTALTRGKRRATLISDLAALSAGAFAPQQPIAGSSLPKRILSPAQAVNAHPNTV